MSFVNQIRQHRIVYFLLSCAVFISGLIFTLFVIRHVFYANKIPKNIDVVSEKLEYFSQHKDEFDTVFLGSSQIYRHIVPSLFDESMQASGYNMKSFNFGLMGLKLSEAKFYLEKILAMQPKNLKWLFFEYLEGFNVAAENVSTSREIYWHTPKSLFSVSRLIWESDRKLTQKAQLFYYNLLPSLYNIFNSGEGSRSIQSFLNPKPKETTYSLGKLEDGYLSLNDEVGEKFSERNQVFLNNLDEYSQKVDRLKKYVDRNHFKPLKPYTKKLISQAIESSEKQGIEMIFLITPGLSPREITHSAYSEGLIQTLFNFENPNEYSSLYQPEKRFDTTHLNRDGAIEFTQLLANRFARHLQKIDN